MGAHLDLTGNRYGKLTALRYAGRNDKGQTLWLLRCDCGKEVTLPMADFKYGKSKNRSCGCNNFSDLTGQKFNRLTVIKRDGKHKSGNIKWLCRCDCGNYTHVTTYNLKSGNAISCGCYTSERMTAMNRKHGGFGTRLYEIWRQMHRRCYGVGTKAYKDYGGRGITICDEWKGDFESFRKWALSNGYTDDLTIDRIDNDGNYDPSNCRWATMKAQSNNRRNSHLIEYNGEVHTISEWADIYGVDQVKLWNRLSVRDWELEPSLAALGVIM